MAGPIHFPNDTSFIGDLILQRTTPFIRLGGGQALTQWFATGDKSQLFEFLRRHGLIDAYLNETLDEVSNDVNALIQFLPGQSYKRIVSIGPGNGLVELLLYRRIPFSSLLLIDIESSDVHKHGFAQHGSGYASLEGTRQFLIDNGVPAEVIQTCNPKQQALPAFEFDLLLSLLSMGFHYPCDDYATFIRRYIAPRGKVVLDKRKGTIDAGYEILMRGMSVEQRVDAPRVERLLLSAPPVDALTQNSPAQSIADGQYSGGDEAVA